MNLICGINPVLEALNSGTRHFDRLLVAKGLRNRRISDAISKASGMAVPLRFETRETLDRMAGSVPHQGLIAVVSPRPQISLEELLGPARDPALFVVLDGVEDPRNLGAILRTAEAAGCRRRASARSAQRRPLRDREPRVGGRARARARGAHRQRGAVARSPEGAGHLGGGLRRHGHRALGRGGLQAARCPRARR